MRNMKKATCHALMGALILMPSMLAISPSQAAYTTSWIGNTFGGANSKWVQNNANSIFVEADGTIYTNSEWDEGGHEAGVYKNGDLIGACSDLHGWGRSGGLAVTTNASYIYLSTSQAPVTGQTTGYPPAGTTWQCVRRYNKTTRTPAPFTGGGGWDGSMLVVNTTSPVTGLAVYNNELYVSDPSGSGAIRVYDPTTMAVKRSWTVATPGPLAFDSGGYLWVIQGTTLKRYSTTGVLQSQQITGISKPTALCGDASGRLLVTENGVDQQIRIYTNVTVSPILSSTLGTTGGIFAGTTTKGVTGALKFNGPTGVGKDSAGNTYVSCNGWGPSLDLMDVGLGLELKSFNTSDALNWQLQGLEWVDNADADPGSEADVFTKHEHFTMNYNNTTAGTEGSYTGFTLDRFTYPNDPRLNLRPGISAGIVRRIGGQRFLFGVDQMGKALAVYRFKATVSGEIAIPCAVFCKQHLSVPNDSASAWPPNQPASGPWSWRDTNANGQFDAGEFESDTSDNTSMFGWYVDSQGSIWKAMRNSGIRKFTCSGLDANGVPIWSSYASSTYTAIPAPFTDLQRAEYDAPTDTMYLSGYTATYPNSDNHWGEVGKVIARYNSWSTSPYIASAYPLVLPYASNDGPKEFDRAGSYLFVVYASSSTVRVYNRDTGVLVATLTPGAEVGSASGWNDTVHGIHAYRRGNGEYLIFVEEDWRAKVLMYRWTP